MSGNKKTADLHSLRTRQFIMPNPDGSFPPTGSLLAFADDHGKVLPTLDVSVNTAFIHDLSAHTISSNGDIVVNNANIYVYGDQNLTGSVQATYVTLSDPSQNNAETYLWANNTNLLWQNSTATINISQAVNNMSIGDGIQLINTAVPSLTDIAVALNQLLTVFGSRNIFVTYPAPPPPSVWTRAIGYPGVNQSIRTISYVGATNFVLGSDGGGLFSTIRYSSNGAAWTNSTIGGGAITASVSSIITALGSTLALISSPVITIAYSNDNGVTFTNSLSSIEIDSSYACAISTNGVTIVVGGRFIIPNNESIFYYSNNGGVTWTGSGTSFPRKPTGEVRAIASNGASTFVAVGSSISVSIDTGGLWSPSTTIFRPTTAFSNVAYYAPNFIAITSSSAGETSAIWWSSDGSLWNAASGIAGSTFVSFVAIAKGATNIVVGGSGVNCMFYSANNGTSWSPVVGTPFSDGSCKAIYYSSGTFYAIGTTTVSGNNIWQSTDDGITWTVSSNTAFGPGGSGLAITGSSTRVVAVGNHGAGSGDVWYL